MSKIWFFGDSFAHPPDIKDLSNDKNSYWWGTKLSQKYNILHNSRYDFCIHFIPCIHQLALCQEYNTVYRLELEPVYAVNTF